MGRSVLLYIFLWAHVVLCLPSTFFLRWALGQLCHDISSPCRRSIGTPRDIEEVNPSIFEPFYDDAHLCKACSAFNNYKPGQLITKLDFLDKEPYSHGNSASQQ